MADTRNPSLTVTNNTAGDAIFASAFSTAIGEDGYAQTLSGFPTSASSQEIAAGSSGNLTLDKTYDDHGVQKPILIYDLIGMRPADLFPLTDQSAAPIDCATHPSAKCQNGFTSYYADIAMTADEATGMTQAFSFSKNISAYPEVDIAKEFATIFETYGDDPEKLEQAVDAFFATQTKNYTKCTLGTYIAATTYTQQFAFSWANQLPQYTYYVFAVNQDQQPKTQGFSKIGTITFVRKSNAPSPADVTDRNGGYDINYVPTTGASRVLNLVNANLVTASNPEFPDVSMVLSFALKSTFTGDAADNTVWPILAGKIDGFTVVAVAQDSTPTSSWYEFFHPQSAQQWIGLIGSIIGIGFAIFFIAEKVYKLVKWYKARKAQTGVPPDRAQIGQRRRLIDSEMQDVPSERESLFRRSGVDKTIPRDYKSFVDDLPSIRSTRQKVLVRKQVDAFGGVIEEQVASLRELIKVANTPEIQEAFSQLKEAHEFLDGVRTRPQLEKVRAQLTDRIGTAFDTIRSSTRSFAKQLGEKSVKEIEEHLSEVDRLSRVIEDDERQSESEEEGQLPEDEI
ncbi:MAG: hypothetical protein OEU68_04070 [Nitrospira sp.]|nr:hypothetical protein [Nitrospira sp.]MDH4242680.1 hypothetical protein [Nitrospira sp.]MDH4355051.1 hypothetical protein [Nitrospira sp.]MDH5316963.1 hypothetical protein [Nitrospira sp.]